MGINMSAAMPGIMPYIRQATNINMRVTTIMLLRYRACVSEVNVQQMKRR